MKFYCIATLFTLLLTITQVLSKGYHCSKYIVIKHGDRCKHITSGFSFDKDYQIDQKSLYMINPTINCSNLKRGQKICVETDPDYYEKDAYDSYLITKNDKSCDELAKKLKTSLSILKNVNQDVTFNCSNFKKMRGYDISYRKDGKYNLIFPSNSKKVSI